MDNPWESIPLSDYEGHMGSAGVMQLQMLNKIMKEQLCEYPVTTAVILGAAGGNGLEHISSEKYSAVSAVDINRSYLEEAKARYGDCGGVTEYLCIDLATQYERLPRADLIIADLLIEYIGHECFCRCVKQTGARYVSCVIQVNDGEGFVSSSPYENAFDRLQEVYCRIEEDELISRLRTIGHVPTLRKEYPLPNGKKLIRLGFSREMEE